MSSIYSQRLDKRNFEIQFNNPNNTSNIEFGEITGDQINVNNTIDRGMPFRMTNYIINKNDKKDYDSQNTTFDLYDRKSNLNITYNNYDNNKYGSEINYDIKNSNYMTNNIDILSDNINKLSLQLYKQIQKNMLAKKYVISSLNIYSILLLLYLTSKNKTKLSLSSIVKIDNKQKLLNDINEIFINISQICNFTNFIILPSEYKLNRVFTNNLNKNLLKIISYDNKFSNIKYESESINREINTYLQNRLKSENYIKPEYIDNNNIICLTAGEIRPVWKNNFDTFINDIFYSYTKKEQLYLVSNNKQYNYSKNNTLELIEFDNISETMSYGMIIATGDSYPPITLEVINSLIDNLNPVNFNKLIIPQIKEQNIKIKYNNVLKSLGLDIIFNNIEIPDLILSNLNINISSVIQNINITIDKNNTTNKIPYNNKLTIIDVKHINTPFIYYIRMKTNISNKMFLCFGQYC